MKMTNDSSKLERILICKNEGVSLACPCELSEACKEYVEEAKKRER